jgi:M6 family metalloprotease-like protein
VQVIRGRGVHASAAALLLAAWSGPAGAVMPTRAGAIPPAVAEAFQQGLFAVAGASVPLGTTAPQPRWHVPVILVDFTDQPLRPEFADHWDWALFDTSGATPTGSVFDYYRWASGNRLRVTGKVVAVVHLKETKDFYAANNWGLSRTGAPRNSYGVVDDALRACDSLVDWGPYDQDGDGYVDMLWVIHSGFGGEATVSRDNLWSITSRMTSWSQGAVFVSSHPFPGGGAGAHMRLDRFSILPELSSFVPGQPAEIGVYCHEFGHALGLPDLYDTLPVRQPLNVGPGNWSLMSTGVYGGDGLSPQYPSHLGAWPMLYLGWSSSIRPATDTLLTLAPLARGAPVIELWFQGESNPEHFLIENRQRVGFDRTLSGIGLIVYQVDDAAIGSRLGANMVNAAWPLITPGLRVLEADGLDELLEGSSHGDPRDPFPGESGVTFCDDDSRPRLRTFAGVPTNLALSRIEQVGENMRFLAQVRSTGWLAARNRSQGPFTPIATTGPATRAVQHADNALSAVYAEVRDARAQVMLRERRSDGTWLPPRQLSASSASALEPSVATLPGGDLAVAWSDTRHGSGEIYYRARVRGVWTAETRLTDLPGHSRMPSIAADRAGGVHVAWLYTEAGTPRVMFLYFPYLSPFGDPRPVSRPSDRADAPLAVAAPDGACYILWPDRSTTPTSIWFARFHPDSGVRPRNLLAGTSGTSQPGVHAVVDAGGSLHAVWQTTGSPNEIHYQRRGQGQPFPRDTVIERRGEPLQNPRLALDNQGGIHLVVEALVSGISQIRYKHFEPDRGWEWGSTEITRANDGTALRPAVLPRTPRVVTVLYTGYPAGQPALIERVRDPELATIIAVTDSRAAPPALRVGPNPVRQGATLALLWSGSQAPGGPAEIFDLAGRRLLARPFARRGASWVAELGRVTWPSGVYFARAGSAAGTVRLVVIR